jgi:signal transduction histidine kinase/ActR/RegA family two-component response regulator
VAPDAAGTNNTYDDVVLVCAPTGRDMQLTCALLSERAAVRCEPCADVPELCAKIRRGAGVAVAAEEALDGNGAARLIDALAGQVAWSDLPVLILASAATHEDAGGEGPIAALRQRGNITVLDRPVRIVTLVSAVQSALRARRRQYEVRDLLVEMRAAVRHRDQFLAMLGHELRNPLGAINNAMGVLDAASPPTDATEREHRDIIHRQTDHLARLVDDLLDVSRITSGKIALQKRPTDLCEVLLAGVRSMDGLVRAQRHELRTSTASCPVLVDGDSFRLEQVVNNLLTNAIKYTPPDGKIEAGVRADGNSAVLYVRDNGIGIPRDLLPRVFDLFTQSERALDRSQGGLGIGLTLVRALVEMHGGTVQVESDGPGAGCLFTIRLPRVEAPRTTEPAADVGAGAAAPRNGNRTHDPAPGEGRRRKILLVEDQPDARRALQRLLQIWGHSVDAAGDGLAGLERAVQSTPEIALIDVGLPGLDGYEVARRIRAKLGNAIRLVALTGYGQPEDRDRAYAAGFDLHLVKPVDRDQLARALADSPDMMAVHDQAGRG